MSCCCNNILQLCSVPVCGDAVIKTGHNAASNGVYKLVLDYLGIEVTIEAEQEIGEEITFPSTNLNEDYTYQGKVLDEEGNVVEFTVEEIVYNCISFQTKQSFVLNP